MKIFFVKFCYFSATINNRKRVVMQLSFLFGPEFTPPRDRLTLRLGGIGVFVIEWYTNDSPIGCKNAVNRL